ncbi:AraC family transcriptional regulator [Marinilabiliaceae bacterium JC017]|nr:AraC family transcriptional regulator [Marinilabiliaceae bacterium JC017]
MNIKECTIPKNFRYCTNRHNRLCCCSFDSEFCKDRCLNIATRGEAAVFVFSDGCKECTDNGFFRQCKSCGKRFNLLYLTGENDFLIKFDTQYDKNYKFVVLSKDRFHYLTEGYPSLFEPVNSLGKNTFFPLLEPDKYFTYEICQIIGQIQNCQLDGKTVPLYIEAKILELLAFLLNAKERKDKNHIQECVLGKVYKARKILEKHYQNPPNIRDLALLVGTNETTLKTNFRNLSNTTIYNYLLDYRMSKAKEMLLENKQSILSIAKQVGYDRQANFTTAFKRKFGLTPSEFLKENFN